MLHSNSRPIPSCQQGRLWRRQSDGPGVDDYSVTLNPQAGCLETDTVVFPALSTEGASSRVFLDPLDVAFRAGRVTGTQWDAESRGLDSVALGLDTVASGISSTAIGDATLAEGDGSTAMGLDTEALGFASTAMGNGAQASGAESLAAGLSTVASGPASTALGHGTVASGADSVAMGLSTVAFGTQSTATGLSTTASGAASTAIGHGTLASGADSFATGLSTVASGAASTALGHGTLASGADSVATGLSTVASGAASTALGHGTLASNADSFATGLSTVASGAASTALGHGTLAAGADSVAMGLETVASATQSTAIGHGSVASGVDSTATGLGTIASGTQSTAMGSSTRAMGDSSFATGLSSVASGATSTALGHGTLASGSDSTAVGLNTAASGATSTAFGSACIASGDRSVAFGNASTASGVESVAGGISATASHANSFVWAGGDAVASTTAKETTFRANGGFRVLGPGGLGAATPYSAGQIYFDATETVVTGKLSVTGLIDPTGLQCTQQISSPVGAVAGTGTYWVYNNVPTLPFFTDSAGTATRLIPATRIYLRCSNSGGGAPALQNVVPLTATLINWGTVESTAGTGFTFASNRFTNGTGATITLLITAAVVANASVGGFVANMTMWIPANNTSATVWAGEQEIGVDACYMPTVAPGVTPPFRLTLVSCRQLAPADWFEVGFYQDSGIVYTLNSNVAGAYNLFSTLVVSQMY